MELTEDIKIINKRLIDRYGREWDSRPIWRVVWSDDQMEKRIGTFMDYSTEGIFLREVTEMRELPKYKQWINQRFILEKLTPVPVMQRGELTEPVSYEPIWVFEDRRGNALPPKWEAIELILQSIYEKAAQSVGARYKSNDADPKLAPEKRLAEIIKMEEALFGNETAVSDHLAQQTGVTVPTNFNRTKEQKG